MSSTISSTGTASTATSSSSYQSGDQLTSLTGYNEMQVTGLASGLDTDAIVQAEMGTRDQQVTDVTNQQTGLTDQNTELTDIQNALQTVASDAQALGSESLFAPTQTITSTDATTVSATANSGTGAVVGGYEITVTALASASQRTFSFTSPSSADTVTIDGQQISLAAGSSADSLASQINSNNKLDVWATVTQESSNGGPATIVLSSRTTGLPPESGYINVSDTAGALTDTGDDIGGTDAAYTINNTGTQYSSSNTITGASLGNNGQPTQGQGATETIPGVTLSLNGLTGSTPVTIDVGSPTVNSSSVQAAVQQFITDYNSAVSMIETQLSQAPSSSDPSQGTLYGDSSLSQLLSSMRNMMDSTLKDLPSSMDNMLDLGVNTGAATGSGAISQSSLDGDLTLDTSTLTSALASNSDEVQSLLTSWSIQFSDLANNAASPGGSISTRISGNQTQINYLGSEISNMDSANSEYEQMLVQQFADMESAVSKSQSTSSWLTGQTSASSSS